MFSLSYAKKNNNKLFSSLEDFNITKPQNYIPIYKKFFNINSTNYNNFNLNNKNRLYQIDEKKSENIYICQLQKDDKLIQKKNIFIKFSPLLDPIKYMTGKYDISLNNLLLPNFDKNNSHKKILRENNSAYTDFFFIYLSDQLFNNGFIHGINFYGSFIGCKQNYYYNIYDDFEYLNDSDFFHTNIDKLFTLENNNSHIFYGNSKNNRSKLTISNNNIVISTDKLELSELDNIFNSKHTFETESSQTKLLFKSDLSSNSVKTSHSSSTCSSRSSYTDNSSEEDESDDESDQSDESSESSNETFYTCLKNFPVNIISMELLDGTLDSLICSDKILTIPEWKSCIFQILFMLTVYQKTFSFTHNDLHTNNIMFKKIDKQYLFYYVNDKYYKIPTFGKIFKIIDFGRSIYKFKDKTICSDSFAKKEDAATQYNFGEFFDKKKKIIEPNFSFDLTRLACSLYDFFVPFNTNEKKIKHPIGKLIIKWCKDDRGKNILYKSNGDERYPDFKLYKMITRTVHNHLPHKELENSMFNEYIVRKKQLKKKKYMNINSFSKCYT